VVEGIEADDAVGIAQYQNRFVIGGHLGKSLGIDTVICSRDKDLHMIPGWHYTWSAGAQKEKPLWWQDETEALRCFYRQLLTGDSTDNIPGLYGVGPSSSCVKCISTLDNELDMFRTCYEEYEKRFGSYAEQFIKENADLLWILREENVRGSKRIEDNLESLRLHRELEQAV
jgi:5'-3' exonuclease